MKENQDRNIQNVYRQIVEISKKYQVKKVVLFGSRARGTNIINMDDKYVSSELVSEIEKDGVVLYEKV